MAKIGYIRVSSQDQNLDRQVAMLNQLKIDKLFQEKASGKDCNRPEFQKLLILYSRRRLCYCYFS